MAYKGRVRPTIALTAADIAADAVGSSEIAAGAVGTSEIASTFDISSKTVTLPAASVTAHVTATDTTGIEDDIALLGFKVAANGSLARYDLVDQSIDVFEDASGVDASASTDEVRNASNYYSGSAAATGGTITSYTSGENTYTVHTFLSSSSLVIGSSGNVDALVVAGGGGGGVGHGGGGGAGGVRAISSHAVTAQTYSITVGTGGTGGSYSSPVANNASGLDSTFSTISATGGGLGGHENGASRVDNGASGGSGGGGSRTIPAAGTGGSGNAGSYSPVEGYVGGDATGGSGVWSGGGGGGASAAGSDSSGHVGGNGGAGIANDYRTGSNVTYGGGGGGAANNTASGNKGLGGSGGGGNGSYAGGGAGASGTVNTGGGAGGARDHDGGSGGSGIVVIRYTGSLGAYNNLTLISNSTTAQSAPTKGDIVMTYTNGAGTATVNTDIKAYASRDNGTTYTQMTLASQGTTGGHTILTAHDVDISSQPSGTSMRYKITTHNQSASKETRIQAVSLGWS